MPTKGKEAETKLALDDVIKRTIRKKVKKEQQEPEGTGILYEVLPPGSNLGDLYTELSENLFVN